MSRNINRTVSNICTLTSSSVTRAVWMSCEDLQISERSRSVQNVFHSQQFADNSVTLPKIMVLALLVGNWKTRLAEKYDTCDTACYLYGVRIYFVLWLVTRRFFLPVYDDVSISCTTNTVVVLTAVITVLSVPVSATFCSY